MQFGPAADAALTCSTTCLTSVHLGEVVLNWEEGLGGSGTCPGEPDRTRQNLLAVTELVFDVFLQLLVFSLLLLRLLICSARLRWVSLVLIWPQMFCEPSFSSSSALLYAFCNHHHSFSSWRIFLSHLPLCLGTTLLWGICPNLSLPSS